MRPYVLFSLSFFFFSEGDWGGGGGIQEKWNSKGLEWGGGGGGQNSSSHSPL